MKTFILGVVLTCGVFFSLGARSVPSLCDAGRPAVVRTMPLKVSDMTLDRAFRYQFTVDAFSNNPAVIPFPPGLGIIITSIGDPSAVSVGFQVSVNGAPFESFGTTPTATVVKLDPPLVVPPGGSIAVGTNGNQIGPRYVAVAGYFVYPGEV